MKQIVLIFSLFIGFISVKAQNENQDRNERIEATRIAFITERLNLSSKEATVFWPVYNEFSNQLKKIRQAEKMKYPRMLVVGDKEASGGEMTVRVRGEQEQKIMTKETFVKTSLEQVAIRE